MTTTEICRLINISSKTLYLWERSGKIPRPGRDRRGWRVFSPKQVEAIQRYAKPTDDPNAPGRPGRPRRAANARLAGLTARNQIRGTVVSVASDGLLSEVVLRLGDGQEIVAVVTRDSVRRLGIDKGQDATAIIKATEVMLFK